MKVDITILVENTTPVSYLTGEYGFAALVTIDGNSLLFDTGSAGSIFTNARAMGIKLDEVEDLVISHGHYDHTGAVLSLVQEYGVKNIYAHSGLFAHRLLPLKDGKTKDIGCACDKQEVEASGARFIFTDGFKEISPQVFLTGQIPRITDYEDTGGDFKMEVNGELIKDNLNDDMALVIKHPEGLIIISGCAHAGMINTIDYAIKQTGEKRLLAYIGGTHLITASEKRLEKTIAALTAYDIKSVVLCHCTGFKAAAQLYNALGARVSKGDAGRRLKF